MEKESQIAPPNTTEALRVVFWDAAAIHLAQPAARGAAAPESPTMIIVAAFIALTLAVACVATGKQVQRTLRGLDIPLTSYF